MNQRVLTDVLLERKSPAGTIRNGQKNCPGAATSSAASSGAHGAHAKTPRHTTSDTKHLLPRIKSTRKGLDKQYLWLGTAVPGDTLGNFGSAIELLAQRSTYFYEEQGHYWFDTQPSVTKTANDYAERLREDVETVWNEITRRLQTEQRARGVFDRVHIAPSSSADIPDLEDTRLVIAHPRHPRSRQDGPDSAAHTWVRETIEAKGASQRIHRNTLIFLLADKAALESLEAATRSFLGWKRVQDTSEVLNLSVQQRKQTDDRVSLLDETVSARIKDTFVWAVYPEQFDPTKPFEVVADRVPESGGRSLAERVSAQLGRADQLITEFGAPILGATLHSELGTLWSEVGEITLGELWGYFTRYTYLPRLVRREVLDAAVQQALTAVLVDDERFGIATGKDAETDRYRGLVVPPAPNAGIQPTDSTLLIEIGRAQQQAEADRATARESARPAQDGGSVDMAWAETPQPAPSSDERPPGESTIETALAHFFGSVKIDPERYSRDIGNVTREVIDRLAGAGARLEITIDIQAVKPEGFDETEVRTISENARTLKFNPGAGFEKG